MNSPKDIPTAFTRRVAENLKKSIFLNIVHQYHVDYYKAYEFRHEER